MIPVKPGKARRERGDTDQEEASSEHFPQTTQPGPGDPLRSDNEFPLPSEGFPFGFTQQTSTGNPYPIPSIWSIKGYEGCSLAYRR